ncbi:hypothetical protein UCRPC4_g00622 [Phaeomoniella chlamydospora]|uniref:Myb-like DNA-binding domain-containing protein n=1 Tax=Phaeomoniella chlamydospora TaxID=158046 RepID=A0A0G2GZ97_PHACM|nr:hypothetical protein UCRPC4_g00622 [Phaeomoniella chlamydospora]
MVKATTEEQLKFLICCVKHSNARVDFEAVRLEFGIVTKGAAAKRYERLLKANIEPSIDRSSESSPSQSPQPAKRPNSSNARRVLKKRKRNDGGADHLDNGTKGRNRCSGTTEPRLEEKHHLYPDTTAKAHSIRSPNMKEAYNTANCRAPQAMMPGYYSQVELMAGSIPYQAQQAIYQEHQPPAPAYPQTLAEYSRLGHPYTYQSMWYGRQRPEPQEVVPDTDSEELSGAEKIPQASEGARGQGQPRTLPQVQREPNGPGNTRSKTVPDSIIISD